MDRKTEAFKKGNLLILAILLVIFLITLGIYFVISLSENNSFSDELISNSAVMRIIDGDTFEMASGEKIRLLCVDTPEENEKGFEEAKQYLSDLILNKKIRLEKGVTDKDQYGRLLRYVYVTSESAPCIVEENKDPNILSDQVCFTIGDEELFVNKELVKNNYASVFVYGEETCDKIL